jgi:hypothetical protein
MNVGVANQFSPLQTDIMNRVMAYRANTGDTLQFNAQQEDKAYRNAMRMDLRNRDMYDMNERDRYSKLNMLNETNPYYSIEEGPRGETLKWKDKNNWMSMITGQAGPTDTATLQEMENYAARLKTDKSLDSGTINMLMEQRFPNAFRSRRNTNNAAAINAQYAALNGIPMGQNMFPWE